MTSEELIAVVEAGLRGEGLEPHCMGLWDGAVRDAKAAYRDALLELRVEHDGRTPSADDVLRCAQEIRSFFDPRSEGVIECWSCSGWTVKLKPPGSRGQLRLVVWRDLSTPQVIPLEDPECFEKVASQVKENLDAM